MEENLLLQPFQILAAVLHSRILATISPRSSAGRQRLATLRCQDTSHRAGPGPPPPNQHQGLPGLWGSGTAITRIHASLELLATPWAPSQWALSSGAGDSSQLSAVPSQRLYFLSCLWKHWELVPSLLADSWVRGSFFFPLLTSGISIDSMEPHQLRAGLDRC